MTRRLGRKRIHSQITPPERMDVRLGMYLLVFVFFVLAGVLGVLLREAYRVEDPARAATLTQGASTITVSFPGRYDAVLRKDTTAPFLQLRDRVEDDANPDPSHELRGPCLREGGTVYCLSNDPDRRTTVLEVTDLRIRLRVEGRLVSAGGVILTDESAPGRSLLVREDYTFVQAGLYVDHATDFRSGGLTLDNSHAHDGYNWLGVYANATSGAFDAGATPDIIYGNGAVETNNTNHSDGATFADSTIYTVLPGNGSNSWQDAMIGILQNGWFDGAATGVSKRWYWDENETGSKHLLLAQERGGSTATTGVRQAKWFFLLQPEATFDSQAKRQGWINDQRNPDSLAMTTGSRWELESGGFERAAGQYALDLSGGAVDFDLDGGSSQATTLDGAVAAGATTVVVDDASGFPSSGVAFVRGDKFSYTGRTGTSFTGVPSSGELAVGAHPAGSVVSLMPRHQSRFFLRNWRENYLPETLLLNSTELFANTDYLVARQPFSLAYFAGALSLDAPLASTTVSVGSDLSNNGCSFVAGRYGDGVLCNSNNEAISLAVSNGTDYDKATGTIEFWYQPRTNHDDNTAATLFNLQGSGSNQIRLTKLADNALLFRIEQGGTAVDYVVDSSDYRWLAYDWVHLRVEWDDNRSLATQQRLFINGVEPPHTGSGTNFDSTALTALTTLYIGNVNASGTEAAGGVIDEFRIYRSAEALIPLSAGGDTGESGEYLGDQQNNYAFDFQAVDGSGRGGYFYLGAAYPFAGFNLALATAGMEGSALTYNWEYWDGSNWSALTVNESTSGVRRWLADGAVYWTPPPVWATYSIEGKTDLYYIRGYLAAGSYSIQPTEQQLMTDLVSVQYLGSLTALAQQFSLSDNQAPMAPTTLFANDDSAQSGATNPLGLTDTTPAFSAIYNDPDSGDTAKRVWIQVSTDSSFETISHWDSGAGGTAISDVGVGARSGDMIYGSLGDAPTQNLSTNNGDVIYHFRIKFWDEAGKSGEWSAAAQFAMLDSPVAPSELTIDQVQADSLIIGWTDNSSGQTQEAGFEIDHSTNGSDWSLLHTTAADVTSYQHGALTPDTRYYYRVRAVNSVGNSDYAGPVDGYTAARTPGQPTLNHHNYGEIRVTVDPVDNPAGVAYLVAFSTDNFVTDTRYLKAEGSLGDEVVSADWRTYTELGGNGGVIVGDLEDNTTYQVRVRARNQSELEAVYSTSAEITTWVRPSLSLSVTGTDLGGIDLTGLNDQVHFGFIIPGVATTAVQRVAVQTNAVDGYRVEIMADAKMHRSGSSEVDVDFVRNETVGTNASPVPWVSPTGSIPGQDTAYIGYRTSDNSLSTGTTNRFQIADRWAGFDALGEFYEVLYHNGPVEGEVEGESFAYMTFKLETSNIHPTGNYSSLQIRYRVVPIF